MRSWVSIVNATLMTVSDDTCMNSAWCFPRTVIADLRAEKTEAVKVFEYLVCLREF